MNGMVSYSEALNSKQEACKKELNEYPCKKILKIKISSLDKKMLRRYGANRIELKKEKLSSDEASGYSVVIPVKKKGSELLEGLGPKDFGGLNTEFKDREIRFFIETNSENQRSEQVINQKKNKQLLKITDFISDLNKKIEAHNLAIQRISESTVKRRKKNCEEEKKASKKSGK